MKQQIIITLFLSLILSPTAESQMPQSLETPADAAITKLELTPDEPFLPPTGSVAPNLSSALLIGLRANPPEPVHLLVKVAEERPWWKYPLYGAGIGGLAGGVRGLVGDLTCKSGSEDWTCGSYTMIYGVLGAAAGAVVGTVVHFLR